MWLKSQKCVKTVKNVSEQSRKMMRIESLIYERKVIRLWEKGINLQETCEKIRINIWKWEKTSLKIWFCSFASKNMLRK